jgi:hypothetical protein
MHLKAFASACTGSATVTALDPVDAEARSGTVETIHSDFCPFQANYLETRGCAFHTPVIRFPRSFVDDSFWPAPPSDALCEPDRNASAAWRTGSSGIGSSGDGSSGDEPLGRQTVKVARGGQSKRFRKRTGQRTAASMTAILQTLWKWKFNPLMPK